MTEPTTSPAGELPAATGLPTAPEPPLAIELKGISKSFGPVHANRDIDLPVAAGSIHGIIGENGAGKSTLMSILYGFYQADSGTISVRGNEVEIDDSQEAIRARHRHGPPAFHAGRQLLRPRERHARCRSRLDSE